MIAQRATHCVATTSRTHEHIRTHIRFQTRRRSANDQKHGVSFEEASTVFTDPLALIFDDETHSINERREIIVGHSANHRLLIVCFTERRGFIRIYSSRLTTRRERKDYEENKGS
jgi:hypothetical protein